MLSKRQKNGKNSRSVIHPHFSPTLRVRQMLFEKRYVAAQSKFSGFSKG
jgi:hypothetical protein